MAEISAAGVRIGQQAGGGVGVDGGQQGLAGHRKLEPSLQLLSKVNINEF